MLAPTFNKAPGPRESLGKGALFFLVPSIFLFLFVFPKEMGQEIFLSRKTPRRIHDVPAATPPDPVLTSRCLPCFSREKGKDRRM